MAKTRAEKQPAEADEAEQERLRLANAIKRISSALQRLLQSGLNRKAIVVLVADDCKVNRRDIDAVLDSLETLAERYTR